MITIRDLRASGTCYLDGARPFLKRHGIDPVKLRREGVDADVLIATGDESALKVVEAARGRRKS